MTLKSNVRGGFPMSRWRLLGMSALCALALVFGGGYAVAQTHYTTRHIYSETADPKAEIAAAV